MACFWFLKVDGDRTMNKQEYEQAKQILSDMPEGEDMQGWNSTSDHLIVTAWMKL